MRRRDLVPAPLADYRPYRLDVGCRDDNALEQSPFCGVLVRPIDRHEKCTPRHSWRDGVAEREILETVKHLAHIGRFGDEESVAEERQRPDAPKDGKHEFEKPGM
jgi:hypothetical protein